MGTFFSAIIALIIFYSAGLEVHPTPNELFSYFVSLGGVVLVSIIAFSLLLFSETTTFYLEAQIDSEERTSLIEGEGGEQFSMKNFAEKGNYATRIPVHKVVGPALLGVLFSNAVSVMAVSLYPAIHNSWNSTFPLAMWLVFIGLIGDTVGRELSLYLKHLVKSARVLLIIVAVRALILLFYLLYIFVPAMYKNNWIVMAIVLIQSIIGGLCTNFAFCLATSAVDMNSKSNALNVVTGALIVGVFVGLLVSIVILFAAP